MAYREPSAPPQATTRLEYGPYPPDWFALFIAVQTLGAGAMFVYFLAAPGTELGVRFLAALGVVCLAWVSVLVIRFFLGATRRLLIVLEGEGDHMELEVRERRQVGRRTRRVDLRGIRAVELSWFGKHQRGEIVLRFDGAREVTLLSGVGDRLRTVVEDLRRELLPDPAARRGSDPGDASGP